jgi:exonuclease SbcC
MGENDQGKTALAKRAVKWCLFNEPQGDSFIRFKDNGKVNKNGEPERENLCYVTLKFSNGIEVTRKREKNKNFYQLVDENGEIFNFENFGNDVPEEIQKATGISKLKVDDDIQLNLNIIGAKDRSLIYESNNYKSKVIGSFAGTNVIDVTIRGIQADMKNISADIKTIEKDIKELDEKIAEMGDMKEKEEIVKQIDNLFFSLDEENFVREELIRLERSIYDRIMTIENDKKILESTKDLDKREQKLAEFESIVAKAKELMELRNRFMVIINRINDRKQTIAESKKIVQQYKDIDKEEMELMKKELQITDIQNKINSINTTKKALLGIYERIQAKTESIEVAKQLVQKYKDVAKQENELLDIESKLETIRNEIDKTIDSKNQLVRLDSEIERKLTIRTKGRAYIAQKNKEINELIEACVKNIIQLGKCPTCMSDLDASHMGKIKDELINL